MTDPVSDNRTTRIDGARTFARAVLDGGARASASADVLRRRLLPASIGLLLIVAELPWLGERDDVSPTGLGLVLTAAFGIAGTTALIPLVRPLGGALGTGRQLLEQRYQRLVEQLPLVVYVDELDDRSSNIYEPPDRGSPRLLRRGVGRGSRPLREAAPRGRSRAGAR